MGQYVHSYSWTEVEDKQWLSDCYVTAAGCTEWLLMHHCQSLILVFARTDCQTYKSDWLPLSSNLYNIVAILEDKMI